MTTEMQKQVSATEEDQSLIIHEMSPTAEFPLKSAPTTTLTSAQSVPATKTYNNQTHIANRAKSDSKSGTYQFNIVPPANKIHARERSVGNLIPSRYLAHASSLIQLLDQSRGSSVSTPVSKNIPFKNIPSDNITNKEESPSLQSEEDFDTPVPSNKLTKSRQSTENVLGSQTNKTRQSVDSLIIHEDDLMSNKHDEYKDLLININNNNDIQIDMEALAVRAAQEFADLANANDKLTREHDKLREQYDDLLHFRSKMEKEMELMKNNKTNNDIMNDEVEVLKSKAAQWEIEKKYFEEQMNQYESQLGINKNGFYGTGGSETSLTKNRKKSDSLVGVARPKTHKRETSENAERLMMETLAKVTREKNELETMMDEERNMKHEYKKEISNLRKQLKDTARDRNILSSNLDKQQKLYLNLQKSQNQKIDKLVAEVEVGRTRGMTFEEQEEEEKQKLELLAAVDEQKEYIQQLELENQRLNALKVKDDDEMFQQLQQLRTHRFAHSINFDAVSNIGSEAGFTGLSQYSGHSRGASNTSLSNYSDVAYGFALGGGNTTDAYGQLKSARTQINLFGINNELEEFDEEQDDDTRLINYSQIKDEKEQTQISIEVVDDEKKEKNMDTPAPTKENKKKVGFVVENENEIKKKKKEELKRKKMEQMNKVNAEIEFFLLTCLCVKANLYEEYPNNAEVMTENPMHLFESAQKEHIRMAKFSLWIELKLRIKYDLPKLKGFKKFIAKHHIDDKIDKTKAKSKEMINKTGTLIKETGKEIKEIGARIRAHSKSGYNSDTEQRSVPNSPNYKPGNPNLSVTITAVSSPKPIKEDVEEPPDNNNHDRTQNKEKSTNDDDDQPKVNNDDDDEKKCGGCIIM